MGKKYGAVSFLKILAPELNDRLLADFLDMESSLIVSMHIQSVRGSEKRNSSVFLTHTELLAGAELKGAWCNKILCGQTGRSQPVPFKLKRELFIHVEYRMKLKKPFFTVQRSGAY